MREKDGSRGEAIPLWRARARLTGGNRTDAACGFGGPDVAEAVGTAEEVGAELDRFLSSLERQNVEAERLRTGRFAVELEFEPLDDGLGTLGSPPSDLPAERPVPLWEATAVAGNTDGVFDACYRYGNSQGDEGHLLGTAQELGAELARVLQGLSRSDVEAMKYGTDRFFLLLVVGLPQKP
jgi:hypothetical protein